MHTAKWKKQIWKAMYCMISTICHSGKSKTMEIVKKSEVAKLWVLHFCLCSERSMTQMSRRGWAAHESELLWVSEPAELNPHSWPSGAWVSPYQQKHPGDPIVDQLALNWSIDVGPKCIYTLAYHSDFLIVPYVVIVDQEKWIPESGVLP